MTDLAPLKKLLNQSKTKPQQLVSTILEKRGIHLENLIDDLVIIAQTATKSTPDGGEIEDHKTRLSALRFILELSGDYVPKRSNVNIITPYANLLYKNSNDPTTSIQPAEEVILGESEKS